MATNIWKFQRDIKNRVKYFSAEREKITMKMERDKVWEKFKRRRREEKNEKKAVWGGWRREEVVFIGSRSR